MDNPGQVIIRKFESRDRGSVRSLSCDTAFLGLARENIFSDDEVLSDALVSYYTDYEPGSCFVAEFENRVVGYVAGSIDIPLMNRIGNKMALPLFLKALRRGVFFQAANLKFIFQCLKSALKGEFYMPDFSKQYPATLHINIDKEYRNHGVGQKLIHAYLDYLSVKNSVGVHFGTFSEDAKDFFLAMGFSILFQGRRSYLVPYLGKEVNFYVLGKKL